MQRIEKRRRAPVARYLGDGALAQGVRASIQAVWAI
jgi:hypothetical protein